MVEGSICFDVVDLISLLYLLHGSRKAASRKPVATLTLYILAGPQNGNC